MDDFGLLVGRHFTTLPTLSNEQLSELQLDSSGRLIISGRYLEDAAHSSGDAGIFTLAVRADSDGSLVDSDGDYAPLQVDADGKLKVAADVSLNSEYAEDAAHTSGDSGQFILAVRNDANSSLVDTDGDYAPLQVDADGRLKVATVVSVEPSDAEFAEDSAHSDGDTGLHMLAVRQDTLASSVSADGDYASLKVDADGELYVTDEAARASLSAIETDAAAIEAELLDQGTTLDNIETDAAAIEAELLDQGTTLDNIETEVQSLSHDEDAAHSSGDAGVMSLAVRADSDGSLVDTDGDYAPLQVNAEGKLKVAADLAPPGAEQYTVTDALAAAGDGLETITAAATPWVTVASFSHTSGTAYVYGYQWACDQNAQVRLVTDDTTDTIVYKTGVNSSGMPGMSEHWGEGGRIEIAGAANLEIRLQIKKRSSTGGNANGTGSIHIRTV